MSCVCQWKVYPNDHPSGAAKCSNNAWITEAGDEDAIHVNGDVDKIDDCSHVFFKRVDSDDGRFSVDWHIDKTVSVSYNGLVSRFAATQDPAVVNCADYKVGPVCSQRSHAFMLDVYIESANSLSFGRVAIVEVVVMAR